jgi:hypothetical protein
MYCSRSEILTRVLARLNWISEKSLHCSTIFLLSQFLRLATSFAINESSASRRLAPMHFDALHLEDTSLSLSWTTRM